MKKLKLAAVTLVLVGFLNACQKQEVDDHSTISYLQKTWSEAANELNPVDSMGLLHNAWLDSFQVTPEMDSAAARAEIFRILNLIDPTPIPDSLFSGAVTYPMWLSLDSVREADGDYIGWAIDYRTAGNDRIISADQEPYWSDLANQTSSMQFGGYAFVDSVIAIENAISDDSELSAIDKDVLLAAMSVARYSFAYWQQEYENPLSKWGTIDFGDLPKIILADVIGIAVGAAAAVLGGVVAGGLVLRAALAAGGAASFGAILLGLLEVVCGFCILW